MNTQIIAQKFILDADRAYLARVKRRILRGDAHLIPVLRELQALALAYSNANARVAP